MSQPSRPRERGTVQRRRRDIKLDRPVPLETRSLMAPVVATFPLHGDLHGGARRRRTRTWGRSRFRENTTATIDTDGADHVGVGADADLVVRRRYRDDRGRARRGLRQRSLRDLPRARATTRRRARSTIRA